MNDEDRKEARELKRKLIALFSHLTPEKQMTHATDLVAMIVAQFPERMREGLIARHLELMRALIPINEELLKAGHHKRAN